LGLYYRIWWQFLAKCRFFGASGFIKRLGIQNDIGAQRHSYQASENSEAWQFLLSSLIKFERSLLKQAPR